MLLAISGTPCTGKTSVAKELGKILGWKVLHLNDLAEEKDLYCGYDDYRKAKIVDIEKIRKVVFDTEENNIIIESHFAHDIQSDMVVILRTNPKELRKRMEERGWDEKKIEENIEAEIMEICLEEARSMNNDIYKIDTTGRTTKDVSAEIAKALKVHPKYIQ